MRFLGIDLAWRVETIERPANRSGVVALDADGRIIDGGWTIGLQQTCGWIQQHATSDTRVFIDAPLVVPNATGMRECEREVGQRYGAFKVAANATNQGSARLAGVKLRIALEADGWSYEDGADGPITRGRVFSECYPYTTIVGAEELGYDVERPPYKRLKKGLPADEAWPLKLAACDELISRVAGLADSVPPLDLSSHPATRVLVDVPSPRKESDYKQREDLLDAALCAWTAALWHRHGLARCQVLGANSDRDSSGAHATIIAPARDRQRAAPRLAGQ